MTDAELAGALLLALRASGEAEGEALGRLGDRRSDDLIGARRPSADDPRQRQPPARAHRLAAEILATIPRAH